MVAPMKKRATTGLTIQRPPLTTGAAKRCPAREILGCTDPNSCNYDPSHVRQWQLQPGGRVQGVWRCQGAPLTNACDCEGNVLDPCGDCGGTGYVWQVAPIQAHAITTPIYACGDGGNGIPVVNVRDVAVENAQMGSRCLATTTAMRLRGRRELFDGRRVRRVWRNWHS